jgi:predicted nucleic acid-binding protein
VISLDTNILVRLIVNDDPGQVSQARALILQHGAWVQSTVLLETVWVLARVYDFTPKAIASFLMAFHQTQHIRFELDERLPQALRALAQGIDPTDAIHVAACQADRFATFDKALARRAAAHFQTPTVTTP